MTNTAQQIGEARQRLNAMTEAVAGMDRSISDLKRRIESAKPGEKYRLQTELVAMETQKVTAGELVAEAEIQLAARESDHADFTKKTRGEFAAIAAEIEGLAQQFDSGLRQAAQAFDAMEAAAKPLAQAGLLANGTKSIVNRAAMQGSFDRAFASRLGDIAAREATMADRAQLVISSARNNAARDKARAA